MAVEMKRIVETKKQVVQMRAEITQLSLIVGQSTQQFNQLPRYY